MCPHTDYCSCVGWERCLSRYQSHWTRTLSLQIHIALITSGKPCFQIQFALEVRPSVHVFKETQFIPCHTAPAASPPNSCPCIVCIHSPPTAPKVWHSSPRVWSFTWIRYDWDAWLSNLSCEPMRPSKLYTSKILWWDRHSCTKG